MTYYYTYRGLDAGGIYSSPESMPLYEIELVSMNIQGDETAASTVGSTGWTQSIPLRVPLV
ncbi:MAG TPA: hypothetical protein VJ967_11780 [Clostridia bacterium]|nr:hypothetical protein [Clostridia bacterium]